MTVAKKEPEAQEPVQTMTCGICGAGKSSKEVTRAEDGTQICNDCSNGKEPKGKKK